MVSSALSVASVAATTGMTITGGRGGVATNGAQLRVVSSNSILAAPSWVTWGVNGEDHQTFEYNYLGFCHFWRTSAANGWSESSRVQTNNKWNFWSGIYTPSDARAEPHKAGPAIAEAVRRGGGHVLECCAVRGLETSAGRVSGVITEHGVIRCSQVVLAGGSWSRLFLGNMGIDFPQLKILGSVLRTAPLQGPPEQAVGAADFAFRKRADGGYTIAHRGASAAHIVPDSFRLFPDFLPALIRQRQELRLRIGHRFLQEMRTPRRWSMEAVSPFEQIRVLDPKPDARILEQAQRNLIAAFPAFAAMQVAGAWGGLIDVTPDAVPVIGEVPRIPGFFLASGFSGHGFGIGPGAGRLVADLLTGTTPFVDMAPFRLERFARLRRTTT